jgi:hypothetical protein
MVLVLSQLWTALMKARKQEDGQLFGVETAEALHLSLME